MADVEIKTLLDIQVSKRKRVERKKHTFVTVVRFIISKDTWKPSSPWRADMEYVAIEDGVRCNKVQEWSYGFRTRKSLVKYCEDVRPDIPITFDREMR